MCAPFKPINKYRPTPIIGKIRIKMTQGIFIEDVLFDAYNPKTKIPLKILVNKFMISAYSFKRVTIVIIKITSRRMQIMEKHSRFTLSKKYWYFNNHMIASITISFSNQVSIARMN